MGACLTPPSDHGGDPSKKIPTLERHPRPSYGGLPLHTRIRRIGQRTVIYASLRQELMKQMFDEKVGTDDSVNYDVDLGIQRFAMVSNTGEVTAKAHLLASIAAQPPTILWAYAPLLASHGAAVERAQKVRDYGLAHNEDELSSEEVAYTFPADADQGDVIANVAHDIGSLALTVFGTDYYYYSAPIGGGSRMVLLLESLSEPVPPITLNELYARLPRYLQQVDDIPWSLEGFVELMPGWSLELNNDADAHHARITDDAGRSIRVTYQLDQYDRLTRLEMGIDD